MRASILPLLSVELLLTTATQRQQTLLSLYQGILAGICLTPKGLQALPQQGFPSRAACHVQLLAAKTSVEPMTPANRRESLQRQPSASAFCHKLLFHSWFFSSEGQNLSPWCWPLCYAAESSKYLSPEPAVPLLNQFQRTGAAEIGSPLLNGSSALPLTLLLGTDGMGVGFKKV